MEEEKKSIPMAMLGVNYEKRKLDVEADLYEGRSVSEDLTSAFSTTTGMPYVEAMHTKKTDSYDQIAHAFETLIGRANTILEEEKVAKMTRTDRLKYEKEKKQKKLMQQRSQQSSSSSSSSTSSLSPRTQETQCSLM